MNTLDNVDNEPGYDISWALFRNIIRYNNKLAWCWYSWYFCKYIIIVVLDPVDEIEEE